MSKFIAAAALALLAACAAKARTDTGHVAQKPPVAVAETSRSETRPNRSVACDIRVTRTPNGVRLEAVAHAQHSMNGAYDFVVTSRSAGGSSDITQGGPFEAAAAGDTIVGSAEIGRDRVSYSAVLTLSDDSGELCRTERRS